MWVTNWIHRTIKKCWWHKFTKWTHAEPQWGNKRERVCKKCGQRQIQVYA